MVAMASSMTLCTVSEWIGGLGADVEELLDHPGLAHRWPDHDRGRECLQGKQVAEDAAQVVRCMLAVHDQPIEAGAAGDGRDIRVRRGQPQADQLALARQRLLEGVPGRRHASTVAIVRTRCGVVTGGPVGNKANI